MTHKYNHFSGSLLLAMIVGAGMASAPVVVNAAFAQNGNGYAVESAEESMTPEPVDEAGVYRILGTTKDEVEQEQTMTGTPTGSGPLVEYQYEVESGNLDGAAQALAAVSNRPVTENLVTAVNSELGVETRLTAEQIADRAAAQQDLSAAEREPAATHMIPEATTDTVYEMLGTTREEAEAVMIQTRPSTQKGPLVEYQHAVENGNLDRTAAALAAVSNVPITEKLVNDVNLELGVETRLTAQQVANAATGSDDAM